jgi:peroxiredoxin family protein
MPAPKGSCYWSNELWEAECTCCRKVFHYHEFRKDLKRTNENIRLNPKRRPVSNLCTKCTSDANAKRYQSFNMYEMTYNRYRDIMRKEGNDVDMTYEEFMELWPKDNKCPIRNDITFQRYPKEDRELWTRGGRHWPFTPTVDHLYPDKPMCKENFWVISWRANEIKSDMFVAEIEALYHAIQKRRGKLIAGSDYFEVMEVKRKVDDIKEYVGKYTPKHLESIERHRKL